MSQYTDSYRKAFKVSAAIARYLRVKTPGSLAVCAAADKDLGVTDAATFAAGDTVTVILATKPGTMPMVASGTIAVGADVYGAAGGKISTTSTSANFVGVALTAASADGDIVEVLRKPTAT